MSQNDYVRSDALHYSTIRARRIITWMCSRVFYKNRERSTSVQLRFSLNGTNRKRVSASSKNWSDAASFQIVRLVTYIIPYISRKHTNSKDLWSVWWNRNRHRTSSRNIMYDRRTLLMTYSQILLCNPFGTLSAITSLYDVRGRKKN